MEKPFTMEALVQIIEALKTRRMELRRCKCGESGHSGRRWRSATEFCDCSRLRALQKGKQETSSNQVSIFGLNLHTPPHADCQRDPDFIIT